MIGISHEETVAFVCPFIMMLAGAGPVAAAPPSDEPLAILTFKPKQLCDFGVQLVVTGKSKDFGLPGDRFFIASPGQEVTVINTDTGEQATFLITGTRHAEVQPDGTTEFTLTGLNIVFNSREAKSVEPGLFLLEGKFNFALNRNGTEARVFSGIGEVTNLCEELA